MTGMRPSAINTYIAVSGSPRSWENAQMMAAKAAPSLVTDRSTTPAADRKLLKRPIEWEVGAGAALGVMISCSMRAEIIRLAQKCKLCPLVPGTGGLLPPGKKLCEKPGRPLRSHNRAARLAPCPTFSGLLMKLSNLACLLCLSCTPGLAHAADIPASGDSLSRYV